jgi:Helicase conserved C-terminal domain
MSSQQWGAYEQAREKERMETRNAIIGSGWAKGDRIVLGGELKHSSAFGKSTSYRVKSRQLSNIYRPDDIDVNADIATYSPKIKSIGDKLKPGVKSLIYSNFVQAGVNAMASYLDHIGYKRYDPNSTTEEDAINGYYGVFSGEVAPEDRTTTLEYYNKKSSPLTVLLVSSSGSEGISCLRTRSIYIMDMHWNWERALQVMARGIRYRSHEDLPENERNVQVYIYVAIPPKNVKPTEKTTDAYLLTESAKKYDAAQAGIRLMASVSIECPQFNTATNIECHKCDPGSSPLYLNDLHKDMLYPLPCKIDTKPVDAKEIQLNGSLYYLTDSKRVFTQSTKGEYNEIIDRDVKDWILARAPIESK